MPPLPRPWQERYWPKVDVQGADDCWPWKAYRMPHGYGVHSLSPKEPKREALVHRIAWLLEHGSIPMGVHVLHRCDNPPCCNPAHLFLGTQADNIADMVAKSRQQSGERSGKAKLTWVQVREIRRRFAAREASFAELSSAYGVGRQAIDKIVKYQRWKEYP